MFCAKLYAGKLHAVQ